MDIIIFIFPSQAKRAIKILTHETLSRSVLKPCNYPNVFVMQYIALID